MRAVSVRAHGRGERGSVVAESLVSLAILGIVIASTSRMVIHSIQANSSTRTFTSLTSEVHGLVDDYKNLSFDALLQKFGTTYSSITDGQTATETVNSKDARSRIAVTFTAMKSSSTSRPEAVRLAVSAVHRRGSLGEATIVYETVIAGAT